MFNILPLLYFWLISVKLSSCTAKPFTDHCTAFQFIISSVIPAFGVFGFYRLWLGVVEWRGDYFYYKNRDELQEFADSIHKKLNCKIEPTSDGLGFQAWGHQANIIAGLLYMALGFFSCLHL